MRKITEKGFIDNDGNEHEVDVIICATGLVSLPPLVGVVTISFYRMLSETSLCSFDTSWVPRFPINFHGQNLQDIRKKEALSYLSLGAPEGG